MLFNGCSVMLIMNDDDDDDDSDDDDDDDGDRVQSGWSVYDKWIVCVNVMCVSVGWPGKHTSRL